ncbi:sulfite reductase (ferredoxin) [Planctomycetaceae bacterium]|nr:sulfite reductase (ferredoxin) [Planctomycetaceae bacterium]
MEHDQRFSGKEDYAKHLVKRSNGEVTVDGLYPEKAPGQFMVRVRIPGGRITLTQASALADFAELYADGEWHVDTRENVELHGVTTENVVPLVEAIETVGLTTRGSCGDTVRNFVVGAEALLFDTTGRALDLQSLAEKLSRRFAGNPEFETLPRKFKIGFFSADDLEPLHRINDLGFLEERHESGPSTLAVYVGGGLGREPRLADLFFSNVPADVTTLYELIVAAVGVFNDLGDRKNRAQARFKFVLDKFGAQRVRELILERWNAPGVVNTRPTDERAQHAAPLLGAHGIHLQADGRYRVFVPLIAGDLTSDIARLIVTAARHSGAEALVLGTRQNIAIVDVPAQNVASLQRELAEIGLAPEGWNGPRDVVACPGSAQCRKAYLETREFAHELADALDASNAPAWAKRLRIGLSGCPNACTQPHIQELGFRGQVGVVSGKKRQGFDFLLGGQLLGGTRIGEQVARYLSADEVIAVSVASAELFAELGSENEPFRDLLKRVGVERFAHALSLRVKLDYGHWSIDVGARHAAPLQGPAASLTPREILAWALKTYGDDLLVTSALNAGGVLLGRWLSELAPRHPIYFIDTGKHFAHTLAYRDALARDHGLNIVTVSHGLGETELSARYGHELWKRDADLCCSVRKVEVLGRLRKGKRAWISALRREQGGERAQTPVFELEQDGVAKISPLAALTREQIDAHLIAFGIPQHPLREQGFTSIGCEPCTHAATGSERDGRWSGTGKTECGLHTKWTSRIRARSVSDGAVVEDTSKLAKATD